MKPYLIALDKDGKVHIRRTLSVAHDYNEQEIRYDAKHTTPARVPEYVKRIWDHAQAVVNIERQRRGSRSTKR